MRTNARTHVVLQDLTNSGIVITPARQRVELQLLPPPLHAHPTPTPPFPPSSMVLHKSNQANRQEINFLSSRDASWEVEAGRRNQGAASREVLAGRCEHGNESRDVRAGMCEHGGGGRCEQGESTKYQVPCALFQTSTLFH